MLQRFGALPTEERVRRMTDRDYLFCALNLILDDEETLAALCPDCRSRSEEARCTQCGAILPEENESFDAARFARMMEGEHD